MKKYDDETMRTVPCATCKRKHAKGIWWPRHPYVPQMRIALPKRSHCGRDPSVVGACGGTDDTCSCECSTCVDPR